MASVNLNSCYLYKFFDDVSKHREELPLCSLEKIARIILQYIPKEEQSLFLFPYIFEKGSEYQLTEYLFPVTELAYLQELGWCVVNSDDLEKEQQEQFLSSVIFSTGKKVTMIPKNLDWLIKSSYIPRKQKITPNLIKSSKILTEKYTKIIQQAATSLAIKDLPRLKCILDRKRILRIQAIPEELLAYTTQALSAVLMSLGKGRFPHRADINLIWAMPPSTKAQRVLEEICPLYQESKEELKILFYFLEKELEKRNIEEKILKKSTLEKEVEYIPLGRIREEIHALNNNELKELISYLKNDFEEGLMGQSSPFHPKYNPLKSNAYSTIINIDSEKKRVIATQLLSYVSPKKPGKEFLKTRAKIEFYYGSCCSSQPSVEFEILDK